MARVKDKLAKVAKAAGGQIRREYEALVRQIETLKAEKSELTIGFSLLGGENTSLRKRLESFRIQVSQLLDALGAPAKSPAEPEPASATKKRIMKMASAKKAPAKKKASAKKPAKKKAGNKKNASKKQEAARKLQGEYIGNLRHVPKSKHHVFRRIAKEKGVEAAVKALQEYKAVKAGTAEPANNQNVPIQLDLLKAKAKHGNDSIPRKELERLAKKHGRTPKSLVSLLATTQGKFRKGFLRRAVAGLTKTKARALLAVLAPCYDKTIAALAKEAGI